MGYIYQFRTCEYLTHTHGGLVYVNLDMTPSQAFVPLNATTRIWIPEFDGRGLYRTPSGSKN